MIEAKLRKARRCIKQGELVVARELYQSILQRYPKNHTALQEMRALQQQITAVTAPPPEKMDALSVLYNQGRYQAAIEQGMALLKDYPKAANLYNMLGILQASLGHTEQAAAHYRQAIALNPDDAGAYNNFGVLLNEQRRYNEALTYFARALQCNPQSVMAHNNIGNSYNRLGNIDKALASYRKALQLDPNYVEAHVCAGAAFHFLGQYQQALDCQRRALELKPDYASAHFNISLTLLLTGDFTNGWQAYEWRSFGSKNRAATRGFKQPVWLGDSDLAGKTIFIHSEQGLGDTLQFSRYIKRVAALGAQVIFQVQAILAPLFEPFKDYARLVKSDEPLPEFDVHCPLLSLPLAFATELDSIPGEVEYLQVSQQRISHWQTRLGRRVRPRIGLVWSGSQQHYADSLRSIALATVMQYLPTGYDYISLQYEVPEADRPLLTQLNHVGERFNDFDDTAAVCMQLDVLISVDTSVAHLGGVLGLPTWVLLPYTPDFRWLLERNDSPWYPSVRLFRQPAVGDWPSVLTAVARALSEQQYEQ